MAQRKANRAPASGGSFSSAELAILAVGVLLALAVRWPLLAYETSDFTIFTGKWFAAIRADGAVEALRSGVSNYTPFYIYLLIIVAKLLPNTTPAAAIKIAGLPFDFVCAFYAARIVGLRYATPTAPVLAGLIVLFAPTVILNGAFWGQVDVVSASALLATVYYLLRRDQRTAMLAFALAFAFKFQAIFLLPFLCVMLANDRLDWRWLGAVPAVYLIVCMPAWLAGRPLGDLLTIYVNQAGYFARLTSNAAHVFQWLPGDFYEWFYPAGLYWALGVLMIFTVAVARVANPMSDDRIMQLALMSLLAVPYFMPKMHERYFFDADVLAIPFAFYFPRYAVIAVAITLVSLFSYWPYLFHQAIVPVPLLAAVPGLLLGTLLYDYWRTGQRDEDN